MPYSVLANLTNASDWCLQLSVSGKAPTCARCYATAHSQHLVTRKHPEQQMAQRCDDLRQFQFPEMKDPRSSSANYKGQGGQGYSLLQKTNRHGSMESFYQLLHISFQLAQMYLL